MAVPSDNLFADIDIDGTFPDAPLASTPSLGGNLFDSIDIGGTGEGGAPAYWNSPEAEETRGVLGGGLAAGVEEFKGLGKGAVGLALDAMGADDLAKEWMDAAAANFAESGEITGEIDGTTSWRDVEGLGSALSYIGFEFGRQLPNLLTAVGTGGVGGILGKKVATKAVQNRIAAQLAANKASMKAAAEVGGGVDAAIAGAVRAALPSGAKAIARGRLAGQTAGVMTTSTIQNTSETGLGIYDETGQIRPDVAFTAGLVRGAMDAVTPMTLLRKWGLPKAAENTIFSRAVGFLSMIGQEATTEAAQEAVGIAAESWVAENKDLMAKFGPEATDRIIDAFMAGGAGITPVSAANALRSRNGRKPKDTPDTSTTADEVLQEEISIVQGEAEAAAVTASNVADTVYDAMMQGDEKLAKLYMDEYEADNGPAEREKLQKIIDNRMAAAPAQVDTEVAQAVNAALSTTDEKTAPPTPASTPDTPEVVKEVVEPPAPPPLSAYRQKLRDKVVGLIDEHNRDHPGFEFTDTDIPPTQAEAKKRLKPLKKAYAEAKAEDEKAAAPPTQSAVTETKQPVEQTLKEKQRVKTVANKLKTISVIPNVDPEDIANIERLRDEGKTWKEITAEYVTSDMPPTTSVYRVLEIKAKEAREELKQANTVKEEALSNIRAWADSLDIGVLERHATVAAFFKSQRGEELTAREQEQADNYRAWIKPLPKAAKEAVVEKKKKAKKKAEKKAAKPKKLRGTKEVVKTKKDKTTGVKVKVIKPQDTPKKTKKVGTEGEAERSARTIREAQDRIEQEAVVHEVSLALETGDTKAADKRLSLYELEHGPEARAAIQILINKAVLGEDTTVTGEIDMNSAAALRAQLEVGGIKALKKLAAPGTFASSSTLDDGSTYMSDADLQDTLNVLLDPDMPEDTFVGIMDTLGIRVSAAAKGDAEQNLDIGFDVEDLGDAEPTTDDSLLEGPQFNKGSEISKASRIPMRGIFGADVETFRAADVAIMEHLTDPNVPGSLNTLLDAVITSVQDPSNYLYQLAVGLRKRNLGDIEVVRRTDEQVVRDLRGDGAHGYYSGTIHPNILKGDDAQVAQRIVINDKIMPGEAMYPVTGITTYILLHEAVHGFTITSMRTNPGFRTKMLRIFKRTKAQAQRDGIDTEYGDGHNGMYGWANADEFMAEALSNKDFQKLLKGIIIQKKSGWMWLVDAVHKIIFGASKHDKKWTRKEDRVERTLPPSYELAIIMDMEEGGHKYLTDAYSAVSGLTTANLTSTTTQDVLLQNTVEYNKKAFANMAKEDGTAVEYPYTKGLTEHQVAEMLTGVPTYVPRFGDYFQGAGLSNIISTQRLLKKQQAAERRAARRGSRPNANVDPILRGQVLAGQMFVASAGEVQPGRATAAVTGGVAPAAVSNYVDTVTHSGAANAAKNVGMGILSLDNLAQYFSKMFTDTATGTNYLGRVIRAMQKFAGRVNELKLHMQDDILAKISNAKLTGKQDKELGAMMDAATRGGIDPTQPTLSEKNPSAAKVAAHKELRRQFQAMAPNQQKVFRELKRFYRDLGEEIFVKTARALTREHSLPFKVSAVFKSGDLSLISKLEYETDILPPALFAEVKAQMLAAARLSKKNVKGIYFPLKRHGDHYVGVEKLYTYSVKDKDAAKLKKEELLVEDPQSIITLTENKKTNTYTLHQKVKAFELFESENEALAVMEVLKETHGKKATVTKGLTQKLFGYDNQQARKIMTAVISGHQKRLNDINKRIANTLDADDKAALVNAAKAMQDSIASTQQMYLAALPESRLAKSMMHRTKQAGASQDFTRSAEAHINTMAYGIANLEQGYGVTTAMTDLQSYSKQLGGDSTNRDRVIRELNARGTSPSRASNTAKAWGSGASKFAVIWHLITLSFVAMQLVQPLMTTLPYLTKMYGSKGAIRELGLAWGHVFKPIAASVIAGKTWQDAAGGRGFKNIESKILDTLVRSNPEHEKLMRAMIAEGAMDASASMVLLNHAKEGRHEGSSAAVKAAGKGLDVFMDIGRVLPHAAELLNRAATAIAAYELAKQDNPNISQSDLYDLAAQSIRRTQFDYTSVNRPRYFNYHPVLQVATMFKMFPLGMYAIMFDQMLGPGGALSKDATGAERRNAGKAIVTSVVMATGLAGAAGALAEPARLVLELLAALWPDDEEEDREFIAALHNPGLMIEEFLVDILGPTAAEAAAFGLPRAAGFDMSSRVGLQNMMFMISRGENGWETFKQTLGGTLAGPVFGKEKQLASFFAYTEKGGSIAEGARRYLAPKLVKDFLNGLDIKDNGTKDFGGKKIFAPEDFSDAEILQKMIFGFATGTEASGYARRGHKRELDNMRMTKAKAFKRQYRDAVFAKDKTAARRIRREIIRFNATLPPGSKERITAKKLKASLKYYRTRAARTVDGVYQD
jgi:hypothetical protein